MKIVDLHTHKGPHVYCGRRMPGRDGSPLGNPFKPIKRFDAGACLAAYRKWLNDKIAAGDGLVMSALAAITEDSVLACWCVELEGEEIFTAAEVCHCQIICKAVRYLAERGG